MTNDINPGNFDGVNAVVVGRVGAEPENPAYDKTGERGFKEIRIAVSQGYKKDGAWVDTGTLWITHTAPAADLASVHKGDKVRIDETRLEAREFERRDGTTGQAFSTRFGTITVLESKSSDEDDSPFE